MYSWLRANHILEAYRTCWNLIDRYLINKIEPVLVLKAVQNKNNRWISGPWIYLIAVKGPDWEFDSSSLNNCSSKLRTSEFWTWTVFQPKTVTFFVVLNVFKPLIPLPRVLYRCSHQKMNFIRKAVPQRRHSLKHCHLSMNIFTYTCKNYLKLEI